MLSSPSIEIDPYKQESLGQFNSMIQINRQEIRLPELLQGRVGQLAEQWEAKQKMVSLWAGDESIWTSSGESKWLGWLNIISEQLDDLAVLESLAEEVRNRYSHAVLLGMGGASLCPEVLRKCFGKLQAYPDLCSLDSTDPTQVQACLDSVDLESTLFLTASKSGSTLETALLTNYMFEQLSCCLGPAKAAKQFIAITDPGSQLESTALKLGYGGIFHGVPTIGGRYSALSNFGLVTAVVMGLDFRGLLENAQKMQSACLAEHKPKDNPALLLGLLIGAAALEKRNKLTFITSSGVSSLGAWIEQLVAESTGKDEKGIIPVDLEPLGHPENYGEDRVFVSIQLESDSDNNQDALKRLEEAGHPVVRIKMQNLLSLGQEFFRWEMATAVVGSVLGINPFNQPDVEATKVATREITAAYESSGTLSSEKPFFEQQGIQLYAPENYAERLYEYSNGKKLSDLLRAHLDTAEAMDYVAFLPYLYKSESIELILKRIRMKVHLKKRIATCLGFGPRYLHSTGQCHKGGPNLGVFLLIGCCDKQDLAIPGRNLSFGVVKAAQLQGDFDVLAERGRRVIRIHLGKNVAEGLGILESAFAAALE